MNGLESAARNTEVSLRVKIGLLTETGIIMLKIEVLS